MLPVVNIGQKLGQIREYWQPQIVGAINDFHVKLVRISGSFIWHHHETEDEMFLVISGKLLMHHRDEAGNEHVAVVSPGEFVIVPHGMEHMPVADGEVHLMLLEPATTVNTGNITNERTYIPV
jgi:mannose-6-phosphate isomerase-like protein (cupin superfamily)